MGRKEKIIYRKLIGIKREELEKVIERERDPRIDKQRVRDRKKQSESERNVDRSTNRQSVIRIKELYMDRKLIGIKRKGVQERDTMEERSTYR